MREMLMRSGAAGLLAACRWGVLLFLVGLAVDWMADMPAAGRVAILITLLAVSLYKAWQCGWRRVARSVLFRAWQQACHV